jgi:hypothetical protein
MDGLKLKFCRDCAFRAVKRSGKCGLCVKLGSYVPRKQVACEKFNNKK